MQNQIQNPPAPEGRRNSSVSSFKKSLHVCLNLYLKNFLTIHPNKTFNKIVILLFITSCITIFACRERVTPPPDTPQYNPPIVLSLEDVSCTDAFLRVRFVDTTIERSFILKRDGATVASVANSPLDTMLIDENLLPKRIYRYKAYRVKGGASVDSSMELTIETMDTTSHEFSWQIDTLGDGASSVLYDVAIINDTLAYAVGEINVKDSLGNWINPPYNFAKWNGRKWEFSTSSDEGYGYGPLYCIFAFGENDVWVGSSIPEHWNGKKWTFHGSTRGYQGGFWIRKIFGTSSSDLYVVGDGGNIRHYDGARWRRLESGTNVDLLDVYGTLDGKEVWACGWNWEGSSVLLSINKSGVEKLWDNNIPQLFPYNYYGKISTLWTTGQKEYIVISSGIIYHHSLINKNILKEDIFTLGGFAYNIRGFSMNNIFIVGANSMIWHYNGLNWFRYEKLLNSYVRLRSVSVNENTVIAVGLNYQSSIDRLGIIIIGRR